MTISSRTPEGSPGRCPVCGHAVRVEPSQPFGDAPCPACGTLLWFAAVGGEPRWFDPNAPSLAETLADRLGVPAESFRARRWDEMGLDSLDLIELIQELEDRQS